MKYENDEDDGSKMKRQCVDCKTFAPKTDSNYTLISSTYGWRLTRRAGPDGMLRVEWRCPGCWEQYKKTKK